MKLDLTLARSIHALSASVWQLLEFPVRWNRWASRNTGVLPHSLTQCHAPVIQIACWRSRRSEFDWRHAIGVGQGGDLTHRMCSYQHIRNKIFGNHCLMFQESYLAITSPAYFFPREDCAIRPLSPLFAYLRIWNSLIRQNVGSLIRWSSSIRFHSDQDGCCPRCNPLS